MKKNIIYLFAILLIGNVAWAQNGGRTSATTTEIRNVASFYKIECNASADVLISQGPVQEVKVEADEHVLANVTTEVQSGTLIISVRGRNLRFRVMRVFVTAPEIQGLYINGSGDFTTLNEIKGNEFEARINGSGDMDLDLAVNRFDGSINGSGDMKIKGVRGELTVKISGSGDFSAKGLQLEKASLTGYGSGDFRLYGEANQLDIRTNSSGDVMASELTANFADVVTRGSGDVHIWATQSLKAETYGSGDIYLKGNPKNREVTKRGSGGLVVQP